MIEQKVLELSKKQPWNHLYKFPQGVHTIKEEWAGPGRNVNKWRRIEPIIDKLNPSGKTMLDVGCSDGYFSIMAAKKSMARVYGIDPDPVRIARASLAGDIYRLENIDFQASDLYDLKETEKFDIILALGLIHRVPDIDSCLNKLANLGTNVILEFKTLKGEKDECRYFGGETKSNKWNGLYYIPTKKYVINKMLSYGLSKYHIFEDASSALNFKRTIMLFTRGEVQ